VRQNFRGHSDGYALNTHNKDYGNFRRKKNGLSVSAVVGIRPCCKFRVVKNIFSQRRYTTLDIARGGCVVACKQVAEISLPVYKKLFVGKNNQSGVNGRLAVGVVLHAMAGYVGYFMKFPVVHLKQGVKYAPLDRFKPILKIGDSSVFNYIRSVFKEIFVKKSLYKRHYLTV